MRTWAAWACLALAGIAGPAAFNANAERLEDFQLEQLFSPESDAAARQAMMQRLVAQAQSGDAPAAFYLGVLYRHGRDHPARLVERDEETARHWLERCVDTAGCPVLALASLAELELAAGNAKPAMQWAQAWVAIERKLDEQARAQRPRPPTRTAPYEDTSYHAYLLQRCYKAMPGNADKAAMGMAWFAELIQRRGAQLDRMLARTLATGAARADGEGRPGLEISAENQRRKTMHPDGPQPLSPALGLFLYRGAPGGGRAESVQIIEALPNPAGARGLNLHARNIKTKPYTLPATGEKLYSLLPVSFNDWYHSLVPMD